MNTYLFASPKFRPLTDAGVIMSNAYMQFYLSDSTTPVDVYTTAALNVALPNPVEANAAGEFPFIYMSPDITYRVQLYNEDDELVWDCDPYTPPRDYAAGTVLMFIGTEEALEAAYPPALWQQCDGTNGTYDLRGRVPIGVSSEIDPGEEVGSEPGTVTTSESGSHDHTGTSGATTAPLPAHTHFCAINNVDEDGANVTTTIAMARASNAGGDTEYALHGTASTPTVSPTSSTGPGGTHTHSISTQADHTHTVAATLPPATGIWFVMRLA